MTYQLIHGDARKVSDMLEPASVDLIVTSPPYFALRSYRDDGEHYDGQLGSEATPGEFIDALIECTEDWLKVLKPGGSIFVNLGDKRAGSGGHNNSNISGPSAKSTLRGNGHVGGGPKIKATLRNAPDRYNQNAQVQADRRGIGEKAMREDDGLRRIIPDGVRAKSLMLLPHRYAIACIERLGLIVRADMIWHKPNGLPESVTDRVRQSHEYWFHLTREPRYFAAVDEIREVSEQPWRSTGRVENRGTQWSEINGSRGLDGETPREYNPLGKLPGSVWTIPSEPLTVPKYRIVLNGRHVAYPWNWNEAVRKMRAIGTRNGRPSLRTMTDHFAAFPSEWPRRLILGWSPTGWCQACGQARRPVVEQSDEYKAFRAERGDWNAHVRATGGGYDTEVGNGRARSGIANTATVLGYRCACWSSVATKDEIQDRQGFIIGQSDEALLTLRGAVPDGPETGELVNGGFVISQHVSDYDRTGVTGPPTRPAVILDPFAGTGTTVAVAHHLGRHGIGIDLSKDYLRLAEWRCTSDTRLRDKVLDRAGLPQAPKIDGQLSLEDLL